MRTVSLSQVKGLGRGNTAGIQPQVSLIKHCFHCAMWPRGHPPPSKAMLASSEDLFCFSSVTEPFTLPCPGLQLWFVQPSVQWVMMSRSCSRKRSVASMMLFSKYQDGCLALLPGLLWWFSLLCIVLQIILVFLEYVFTSFLIQRYTIQIDAIDILLE